MSDRESNAAPKRATTSAYPEAVDRLIAEFSRLPGIGRRSAERLAFHLLKADTPTAMKLARAVEDLKKTVRHCEHCFTLCDDRLCPICASPKRDRTRVLVVEQPKDLIALEQTGMYRGLYHVLMGRLAPLEGVGPDALTIGHLLDRLDHPEKFAPPGGDPTPIEEVILGLNPTLEGDGTALHLAQELGRRKVNVSRLARGLPTGAQLEYANTAVLADAIEGRQRMG